MKERIENFAQMIESYYNKNGENYRFHFLPMNVKYTYVDLHHKYIDGNDNWTLKERSERINTQEIIFIPVIIERACYEKKYKPKEYDRDIRPIAVDKTIDIGNTDCFNYDSFYKIVFSAIPNECKIISDDELDKIASLNGYSKFEWNIYDASIGKPPVAYSGPEWTYDIYGVSLDKEKQL